MSARGTAETALGVDVGGTRIRVARISRAGEILSRRIEPVQPGREAFATQLLRLLADMRHEGDAAVGIGIPGRVRGESGEIVSAGYLDIAGVDLAGLVSRETGLPVRIENDAMMALIAEAHARPGARDDLVMMVTVGTGVGGAVLSQGRPWHGGGHAGQFGHIVVADDGPPCNCGRRGCVETLSSGTALRRLIAETSLPEGTRSENLFAAAEQGDERAAGVLRAWAAPMQRALETLVSVADPALILIGGGLGRDMTRALAGLDCRSPWFPVPCEAARLGDDAGVIGAGLHAMAAGTP